VSIEQNHRATRINSLSLAAPAYNEGDAIETIVLDWVAYLRSVPNIGNFEIVVCDDGSGDGTGVILDRMAKTIPELHPVHFAQNQGAAAALTNAIAHTTGEWVLLIDSDGQFPIENLVRMTAALEASGGRAAIGVRRKKDSLAARFGSWSSGALCNLFHGSAYRDFNSAFKLVYGPLLRSLKLEAKGLNYSTEVTSKLLETHTTLIEVDIEHRPRIAGKSSLRFIRGSLHRFIFVAYIGLRQLMLRIGVLQRQMAPP
jgi:dolichol-phosphate mannosyltransferase